MIDKCIDYANKKKMIKRLVRNIVEEIYLSSNRTGTSSDTYILIVLSNLKHFFEIFDHSAGFNQSRLLLKAAQR